EFFRVTNEPCRINEAGAVSDAARHSNAGDLPGIYARTLLKGAKPADLPVNAADQVRVGDQPQHGKDARPRNSAHLARRPSAPGSSVRATTGVVPRARIARRSSGG